jgi:hypothetical protein
MMKYFLGLFIGLALGAALGCGTTVEACYVHPDYGQVCVKYDGKLHVRADISADPAKLAEVKSWLESQGVKVE